MNTAMVAYCVVLLLVFDFAWSSFTQGQEQARVARIYHPVYDHGLSANFDGYDVWGEARYPLITDSLGFKDGSTREVQLKSTSRRILLIGDSFTEGIGQPFENTFAGLVESRRKTSRQGRVPECRRRLLFAHDLLCQDQIPAGEGLAVRRGRAALGQLRRRG